MRMLFNKSLDLRDWSMIVKLTYGGYIPIGQGWFILSCLKWKFMVNTVSSNMTCKPRSFAMYFWPLLNPATHVPPHHFIRNNLSSKWTFVRLDQGFSVCLGRSRHQSMYTPIKIVRLCSLNRFDIFCAYTVDRFCLILNLTRRTLGF